jgi:hypothetical protein
MAGDAPARRRDAAIRPAVTTGATTVGKPRD